jgi:LDH2 family malate/lactate/ureidoglycolate dehydrogenase
MAEFAVTLTELRNCLELLYQNTELSIEERDVLIDTLIDAELRGIKSHGIIRAIPYYKRVIQGGILTSTQITEVRNHEAISVYDGNHGLGQWLAYKSMENAINKARKYGISAVSIRNSQHFGTAGYFAKMAADEDMIGLVFTNASPRLAPWGGMESILGNNPWAIAVPTSKKEVPFVLDIANSVSSAGRIRKALEKGETISPEWAMNENGEFTTDPAEALKGILLPIAQHKGYGITLAVSILSTLLSDGTNDSGIKSVDHLESHQEVSHLFIAINIDAFQPIIKFKERMEELTSNIHENKKAANIEKIYYPGERGYKMKQKSLDKGKISVDRKLWIELNQLLKLPF